jgi:hypothetical protein
VVRAQFGPVTRVPAVEPSTLRPLVAFDVPYRDGKWLEHGFTLVNDAPFPVTVDQIGLPGQGDPLRQVSVTMNSSDVSPGPPLPDQMVDFRPFTIPPDGARFILVRWEFSGCSLTGSPENYTTAAVQLVKFHMRLGWVTVHRSSFLPMPYSITVSGRLGCAR